MMMLIDDIGPRESIEESFSKTEVCYRMVGWLVERVFEEHRLTGDSVAHAVLEKSGKRKLVVMLREGSFFSVSEFLLR